MSPRDLRRTVLLGFLLMVALLLGLSGMAYYTTRQFLACSARIAQTQQVISTLTQLLSDLKDTETGQRGYLIMGEEQYLEPYHGGRSAVLQSLALLRRLTVAQPLQQQRVPELERLISQKLAELQETIDARRTAGFAAASAIVGTDRGAQLMDRARRLVDDMIETERSALQRQDDQAATSAATTLSLIVYSNGFALIFVALAGYTVYRDTTKYYQTEEALRASEERWQLALRGSNAGIWDWNPKTNTVFFSTRWKTMLGFTEDEIGDTVSEWSDRVHPDDLPQVMDAIRTHFAQRTAFYESEHRVRCKDGSYKWILDRGQALWDVDGKVVRAVGSHTDITSRKQMEEELRALNAALEQRVQERTAALQEREAQLAADLAVRKQIEDALARQLRLTQAITDNATTALFITDDRQQCVFMNPAAEQLTGYILAEVQGRVFHDVVHHTHPDGMPYPSADCPIDRAFPEHNQMQGEEVFIHKDGSFYSVAFTASPVHDGTVMTGTVIEVQDLRARKAAEEASLRLAAIVTSSDDAIVSKTLDGVVTSWNASAERLFGYRAEEMIGQPILRILPVERHTEEDMILARLRRGESVEHFETVRCTKDGRLIDVSVSISPLRDTQGRIIGASNITRDISDRKRAEEALAQHARELARAHADLRQVAYVSAHDLQEPVRQVGVYTQLIAKRYGDSLDAGAQEAVAFIVEGAKRMQAQFTDLMHYLEMEEPDDGISTTDCETVLQGALATLQEPIAASNAMITHDPLPTLAANAKHLQLLFQELIDNAVKFRNNAPPRIHIWAEREENGWRFAVRDNGLGIASQGIGQLFGFFRKLHQRQQYPGTGMGLAICKKIVERHGGRIWLDSRLGEGTTIYFTISDVVKRGRTDEFGMMNGEKGSG